jgi:predicted O-methyltransferase YrrM
MDTTEFLDEVKDIKLAHLGCTYQDRLYSVARSIDAKVIVETGVRSGVSTRYLAEAAANNGGALYSCDPMYPLGQHQAATKLAIGAGIPEGAWTFIGKRSVEALPLFVKGTETGVPLPEWDLFLHDSDSNSECQIFELEFALSFVREGGIIAVNNWKGPPEKLAHNQVAAWAARHGLVGEEVGTAMFYEVPGNAGGPVNLNLVWHSAIQAGIDAVVAFQKTKDGASERPALPYYLTQNV